MIQMDLFATAATVAPPPVIAAKPDDDILEQGAVRIWNWGSAAKNPNSLAWGAAGFRLQLQRREDGKLYARTEMSMHNSGSSGPYRLIDADTEDAALLAIARDYLKHCASHTHGGWRHEETGAKQYAQLARWLIDLCPPLMFGADLAQEYEALCVSAREQEDRRCAMLHASHAIEQQCHAAAIEGGFYGYPDLIQDRAEADGTDAGFRRSWKGHWHVTGHFPGGLEVVIYRYDEDESDAPILEQVRQTFAKHVEVPVRLARAEEYALCYSDRKKVTW